MADRDVGPRIGADPELFISTEKGEIIPVCGLVGGTKIQPIVVDRDIAAIYGSERGRRGQEPRGSYALQEDNVMLEFNIPAYSTAGEFCTAISKMAYYLESTVLGPKKLQPKYGVVDYAFKESVLAEHPQATDIGCTPDFTAYPKEEGRFQREPYSAVDLGNRRFCGGHIHVQYDTKLVPPHVFAQFMDCIACLPYLQYDKQRGRRLFYGQPGLFRVKPYGIEYRTLSSFWLKPNFRDKHLLDMMDSVLLIARIANDNPENMKQWYADIDWDIVATTIRNEDTKKARELSSDFRRRVGLYSIDVAEDEPTGEM